VYIFKIPVHKIKMSCSFVLTSEQDKLNAKNKQTNPKLGVLCSILLFGKSASGFRRWWSSMGLGATHAFLQ